MYMTSFSLYYFISNEHQLTLPVVFTPLKMQK